MKLIRSFKAVGNIGIYDVFEDDSDPELKKIQMLLQKDLSTNTVLEVEPIEE